MSDPSALPPAVRQFLRGYALRARRLAALRGLGWATAILLAFLLCGCLVDRVAPLPRGVRAGWTGVAGVIALLLIARPLLRMRRDIDWIAAAAGVERKNPRFGQRLLTLVSRMAGRTEYRGSPELLDELAFGLETDAGTQTPAQLLPLRAAGFPWLLLAVLLLLTAAFAQSAELNLPQLSRRMLLPWRPTAAVTTTQITVSPGDFDVAQGSAARIEATVSRLRGASVWLNIAEGSDEEWQRIPMSLADENPATAPSSGASAAATTRYVYTIPSVDRDLRYFVSAGDANSSSHALRVLRRPAIAEFRFTLNYPSYTGKLPSMIVSRDGRIDAPQGTEVQLTIVATESLQSALLTMGAEKQLMTPVPGDTAGRSRQGKLTVAGNGRYDIDLITTRQQTGTGPATTEIRAIPDRPPTVRLTGSKSVVRLGPAAVLPMAIEVTDDFGIDSLTWRVNTAAGTSEFPAWPRVAGAGGSAFDNIRGDRRRLEGIFELDLALLSLNPGDVASVTLVARDTGNHPKESDPLTVLITRGTTSPLLYEQAAELKAAAQWAAAATDDLEQSLKAFPENPGSESSGRAAAARASRSLRSAGDGLSLARRAMMRALARSTSSELNGALEAWIDQTAVASRVAELLYRESGPEARETTRPARPINASNSTGVRPPELHHACQQSLDRVRQIRDCLKTVAMAAQATTILADLQNLADAEQRRTSDQVKSILKEMADAAKSIGLADRPENLSAKLKELQEHGRAVARAQSRLDLQQAVSEWMESATHPSFPPPMLGERLLTAARVQADRADGDPRFASDLNLAGIASTELAAAAKGAPKETIQSFGDLLAVLILEHRLRGAGLPQSVLHDTIRPAADAARQQLHAWDTGHAMTTPSLRAGRIEAIALAAGAEAAEHQFDSAASLDNQLWKLAGAQPDPSIVASAQQALSRSRLASDAACTINQIAAQLPAIDVIKDTDARKLAAGGYRAAAEQLADVASRTAPVGAARIVAITEGSPRDRHGQGILNVRRKFAELVTPFPSLPAMQIATHAADVALTANDPMTAAKWLARRIAYDIAQDAPGYQSAADRDSFAAALSSAESRLLRFSAVQRLAAVRATRPFTITESTTEPTKIHKPNSPNRPSFPALGTTDYMPGMPYNPDTPDEGFTDPQPPGYDAAIRAYREAIRKQPRK